MIIPLIVFFLILSLMLWPSRGKITQKNFVIAVLGAGFVTVIFSFFAILILSSASFMYTNEYREEVRTLSALKNTTESNLSGSFFLAGGYLEGSTTPCYYYLEKDLNGGLNLNKVPYYNAQIFFLPDDTAEQPSIKYFWRVCNRRLSPWVLLLPAHGEHHDEIAFKFHIKIPQGSVDSQFQIKL